jgi:hypothetical protein
MSKDSLAFTAIAIGDSLGKKRQMQDFQTANAF